MMRPHTRIYRPLFAVAILLFAMAILLAARSFFGDMRAGMASRHVLAKLAETQTTLEPSSSAVQGSEKSSVPSMNVEGTDYLGVLFVPALDLQLPVALQCNDALLRTSPCAYAGSYLSDDLVICGEGYTSHFGKLRSLGIADEVRIVAVDDSVISYVVSNVEVDRLEEIDAIMDDWDLTLFTFNADGTCLVVRCVRTSR